MIIKEKEWVDRHIEVWTCSRCTKCGWKIDPNEPSICTWNCYSVGNFYHEWCYK